MTDNLHRSAQLKYNNETFHNNVDIKQRTNAKLQNKHMQFKSKHKWTKPFTDKGFKTNLNITTNNRFSVLSKSNINLVKVDQEQPTTTMQKIKIFSDSHGRHLSKLINQKLHNKYKVCGILKPNGKIENVLDSQFVNEMETLTKNDAGVLICGTNDITEHTNADNIVRKIEDKVSKCSHTNILLLKIPYRYDKPWLNNKIRYINHKLQDLTIYPFITLVNLNILRRNLYTEHGLHLNTFGKQKLSSLICENVVEETSNTYRNIPIVLNNRCHFLDRPQQFVMKT